MKKYRIEIITQTGSKVIFWIGAFNDLVDSKDQAIFCSHDQMMEMMEKINCYARCYEEQ